MEGYIEMLDVEREQKLKEAAITYLTIIRKLYPDFDPHKENKEIVDEIRLMRNGVDLWIDAFFKVKKELFYIRKLKQSREV